MARTFSNFEETFRVTVSGTRTHTRTHDYDTEARRFVPLPTPVTTTYDVGPYTYGPYSKVGTARAQGKRETRGLQNAKVVIEKATTSWEAVE